MARNRTGLAPWSLAREAGIESATVDGTIEVPQLVQPILNTGFVDEKGDWKGAKSSDRDFILYQKEEAIAHTASFITAFGLDMTGFQDIQMAIKTTATGNYAMEAIMGSSGPEKYANLSPLNDGAILKGTMAQTIPVDIESLFGDGAVALTQDVWNIFYIGSTLRNQKLLQFKITNNSGSEVDVETTFLRIV